MKKLTKDELLDASINRFNNILENNPEMNLEFIGLVDEELGSKSKVRIKCNKHNTIWEGEFCNFLRERGCPLCSHEIASARLYHTNEEIVDRLREKYGDDYDYSEVNYTDSRENITLVCKTHGTKISRRASSLLEASYKCPCPECRTETVREINSARKTVNFIEKANKVHGDKYDYSKTVYLYCREPVIVICPDCGNEFEISPSMHLKGIGCPNCTFMTKGELLVKDYLIEKQVPFEYDQFYKIEQDDIISLDLINYSIRGIFPDFSKIFLPNLPNQEVWIEYNGIQHYERVNYFIKPDDTRDRFERQLNRDKIVRNYCIKHGIKLIEIPYTYNTINKIESLLDQVLFKNIDIQTLVDYDKLYKL